MLRILVESAPTGMLLLDAAGRMLSVNAAAESIFGYDRAELVGREVELLVPPQLRKVHVRYRAAFMESSHPRAMGAGRELYALHRDGREIPVEIGLNPVETPAGLLIVAAVVDVTERKKAEEEIRKLTGELERLVTRRTAELHGALAEMDGIVHTMSHDLRAPLRHLTASVELLARSPGVAADAEAAREVERIRSSAARMGTLVDELLEYARIGRRAPRPVRFALEPLVREVIEEAEAERSRPLRVSWTVAALPEVLADRGLLRRALSLLVDNALKFTGPRAKPEVAIRSREENRELVIEVSDNGVGFDPAFAGKLFGVFQKLHGRAEFPGNGIGLACVRRIVSMHGGRVWADGVPDGGSTFAFSLPEPPSGLQGGTGR